MVDVGEYHDLPEEKIFLFICNSEIMYITVKQIDIDEKTKGWDFIVRVKPLSNIETDMDKLISLFKEALAEYKYNGLPDNYKQQFVMKINF